jgi:hypothetical protein
MAGETHAVIYLKAPHQGVMTVFSAIDDVIIVHTRFGSTISDRAAEFVTVPSDLPQPPEAPHVPDECVTSRDFMEKLNYLIAFRSWCIRHLMPIAPWKFVDLTNDAGEAIKALRDKIRLSGADQSKRSHEIAVREQSVV